jgi:hypothetical protein
MRKPAVTEKITLDGVIDSSPRWSARAGENRAHAHDYEMTRQVPSLSISAATDCLPVPR